MTAAYRRAGLVIYGPTARQQQVTVQPAAQHPTEGLDAIQQGLDQHRTAMVQQVTIAGQIYESLSGMPSNMDFIRLLESVNMQAEAIGTIANQNARIVEALRDMRNRIEDGATMVQDGVQTGETQPGSEPPHDVQPSPPSQEEERPTQQYDLPTPVRSPASYNPEGIRANLLGYMQQISHRSQASREPPRPGSAVTPFRAGR